MTSHDDQTRRNSSVHFESDSAPSASRWTRRSVLKAGATATTALVAARHGAGAQATPPATPAGSGLVVGVDYLPSPMPGVPDAFLRAPTPYQAISETPGHGGTVTFMTVLWGPPPPNRDQNVYWQELETRLGVTWEGIFVPAAQYGERTATMLAGGDLPDLFYFNPSIQAAHLNQAIEQGAFADLTDYLSGDAIKEWPNLAAIDPAVYHNISINGRIYGIPKLVTRFDTVPFIRVDWAEAVGLDMPASADDFMALMRAFTEQDPDGDGKPDTWGLAGQSGGWNVGTMQRMFRVPNGWRLESDGTLTNQIETEEFRNTVEFCRSMQQAGVYHPDTATMTFEQEEGYLVGGQISLQAQGYASFFGTGGVRSRARRVNPEADLEGLVLPGFDGGEPITYNSSGAYGFTAIAASAAKDEQRVRELLSIMNYLLAPFGSEEQVFLENGDEGVHHTVDENGGRILTKRGESEIGPIGYFPLVWIARPEPQVFFYPDAPGDAAYAQQLGVEILKHGIDNPVMGLYSPTEVENGAELQQLGTDRISEIVSGRADLSALDAYISDWRSRGGDAIRQEYQEALAKQ